MHRGLIARLCFSESKLILRVLIVNRTATGGMIILIFFLSVTRRPRISRAFGFNGRESTTAGRFALANGLNALFSQSCDADPSRAPQIQNAVGAFTYTTLTLPTRSGICSSAELFRRIRRTNYRMRNTLAAMNSMPPHIPEGKIAPIFNVPYFILYIFNILFDTSHELNFEHTNYSPVQILAYWIYIYITD